MLSWILFSFLEGVWARALPAAVLEALPVRPSRRTFDAALAALMFIKKEEDEMKRVCVIEIKDGEIEEIFKEIEKAERIIYDCYSKLKELGVVVVAPKETDAH